MSEHVHYWVQTYYGWECRLCPASFPSVETCFDDDDPIVDVWSELDLDVEPIYHDPDEQEEPFA